MRGLEQIPWFYDWLLGLSERGPFRKWRIWLATGAQGRTLDLGTGTGRNLPLVPRPPTAATVAIDPLLTNLRHALRRSGPAVLVAARAEALPFKEGVFETVLCGLVLCSVKDPSGSLSELRRVLKQGGTLRLLEHVRLSGLGGVLQDLVQPAWTVVTGGCRPNRETERLVEEAGFRAELTTRRASGSMRRWVAHR